MVTKPPVFLKSNLTKKIEKYISLRKKEGFEVRTKIMLFTPLNGTEPVTVKVLISAVKFEDGVPMKVYILRGNGLWQ